MAVAVVAQALLAACISLSLSLASGNNDAQADVNMDDCAILRDCRTELRQLYAAHVGQPPAIKKRRVDVVEPSLVDDINAGVREPDEGERRKVLQSKSLSLLLQRQQHQQQQKLIMHLRRRQRLAGMAHRALNVAASDVGSSLCHALNGRRITSMSTKRLRAQFAGVPNAATLDRSQLVRIGEMLLAGGSRG